jgi:hypothetical protein
MRIHSPVWRPAGRLLIAVLWVTAALAGGAPAAQAAVTQAGAANPQGHYKPSSADVRNAAKVLALDDSGRLYGAARWKGPRVDVAVDGSAADAQALARVDEVLGWLSSATGVTFARSDDDDAPMQLTLRRGAKPLALLTEQPSRARIVAAKVTVDPTHSHSRRWLWEEMLQAAGAGGDWARRSDSVLSTSQQADAPGAFDAWVLRRLYGARSLPTRTVELEEILTAD